MIIDIMRFPTDDQGAIYDLEEMQSLEKTYLQTFPDHQTVFSLDDLSKLDEMPEMAQFLIEKVIKVLTFTEITKSSYFEESITDILKIQALDEEGHRDLVKLKEEADSLTNRYHTAIPEKKSPCVLPSGVTIWQYANENDLICLYEQFLRFKEKGVTLND